MGSNRNAVLTIKEVLVHKDVLRGSSVYQFIRTFDIFICSLAPASEEDVLPNGDDSILPEDGGESPESVFSHEEDAKEESSEKTEEEETTRTETHTEL